MRSRTKGSWPAARSSSQRSAVRRSCQTSARCSGRPVTRSQATTVSRWLVMPIAATSVRPDPRDHLDERGEGRVPDLVGVVLDPAGTGEVLGELAVREGDRRGPARRPRRCAPLSFRRRSRARSPCAGQRLSITAITTRRRPRRATWTDREGGGGRHAHRDAHGWRRLPGAQRGDPGRRPQGRRTRTATRSSGSATAGAA